MRSFNDVFNTQISETALNRINSTLDRLENLINNQQRMIENVSQSTKDRIQALANRVNSKTVGKITDVLEKLTTQQESTPNVATLNGLTAQTKPPQKRTFAKVATGRKIATRVPTAEEPPSLRHHPRRVIGIMEQKPPVHPVHQRIKSSPQSTQSYESSKPLSKHKERVGRAPETSSS